MLSVKVDLRCAVDVDLTGWSVCRGSRDPPHCEGSHQSDHILLGSTLLQLWKLEKLKVNGIVFLQETDYTVRLRYHSPTQTDIMESSANISTISQQPGPD